MNRGVSASGFGLPRGVVGWVAGFLMARTNEAMNATAADVLDVRRSDRVLEIGFGPGRLIHRLARLGAGFMAGIDPSDVMVKQATRLNRDFIAEGRVALKHGEVSHLPYEDRCFDKVCAVNTIQFWPTLHDDLRKVRRVVRDDGLLVLGLRMKNPTRLFMGTVGFTEFEVGEVRDLVERAGFLRVRVEVRQLPREAAAYVLARR